MKRSRKATKRTFATPGLRIPIWTTEIGERIPMPVMSDKHLRNSILYLERKAEENDGLLFFSLEGEDVAKCEPWEDPFGCLNLISEVAVALEHYGPYIDLKEEEWSRRAARVKKLARLAARKGMKKKRRK